MLTTLQRREFGDFLLERGVFQRGDFTLKSGEKSSFFLNFGCLHRGSDLRRLGEFLALGIEAMGGDTTLVFGPAYKGIPMAVAAVMAARTQWSYFSLRKETKQHGEVSDLLGATPGPEDKVVMVDDVLTTSQTKLEALRQLGPWKVHWNGVLVGVDRQQRTPEGELWSERFQRESGLVVRALITVDELLKR
jgi:orotate phosphoribosyltransferase